MPDFVAELLDLLDRTPPPEWERVMRTTYGGTSRYVAAATGRQHVAQLVALGVPRRTASWKIRGR